MRKPGKKAGWAAAAAVAALLAGCGGSGDAATSTDAGSEANGITITAPKDGASVAVPFTLEFDAGDIGPTESGKDHVHIFVDGNESDYTVVEENKFQIDGLSEGEHTINITKQHADHSPAGAEAEIKVNVTGGDTSGGSGSSDEGSGGPDYDY
jgi:hypothetical protein